MNAPSNRLAGEASLYLRQHAHNPVDWYPWGPEALEASAREGKPILVSIGYAACHWCHVMERESFEDPEVAAFMNARFINIKVDREERPDVDRLYMSALISMTGQGGWPLNCFLAPDRRPFFAGTYFPPSPRHRLPSWRQVLAAVLDLFENHPDEVERNAKAVIEAVERRQRREPGDVPEQRVLDRAYGMFVERFDARHGGFGDRPKFPNVMNLELMSRVAARRANGAGMELVGLALTNMARGGIYDHLGGGFARYSTDAEWLAPHFEKMLYDNALLPRIYLDMFRRTGHAPWAQVTRGVFEWIEREMLAPEGGLYAALDADSEGEEGKFYVWGQAEIEAALGVERARVFGQVYDVTASGNWEGKTILRLRGDVEEIARAQGLSLEALEAQLEADRGALLEIRSGRVRPARDEKRICAWNGLAIQALARGAAVLGEPRWSATAARCADFVAARLVVEGGLMRIFADHEGVPRSQVPAFLDDYAYLAHGLLDLFKALGRPGDLAWALSLAEEIRARFFDPDSGELYQTPHGADELPVRGAAAEDEAVPSAAGEACLVWLRLGALTGDEGWTRAAEAVFRRQSLALERAPVAFPSLLCALDLYHEGAGVTVVVGEGDDPRAQALLARARATAGPEDDVIFTEGGRLVAGLSPDWLEGRGVDEPTAFVCRGRVCLAPVTNPLDLFVAR